MKKLIIIFFFFLVSCGGYKPIYSKNNELILEFNNIITTGNEKINLQIINMLNLKQSSSSNYELLLTSNYNTEETSKNLKGEIDTYRSVIKTQLVIKNNDKIIKSKNFLKEFSYNNKNNRYELIKYQNEIRDNLIYDLSGEIVLFLKLL